MAEYHSFPQLEKSWQVSEPVSRLHLISSQFGHFCQNVQYPSIHYSSCLCMLCVCASGQVQSGDPAGLGSRVQMRLCVCLVSKDSDQSAKPSVFLLCVCISVGVCVFVGMSKSEGCQPCPEQPSLTAAKRCGTKRPLSKWEKECACVLRVCVHFLNASLVALVYERGLVLLEQMRECWLIWRRKLIPTRSSTNLPSTSPFSTLTSSLFTSLPLHHSPLNRPPPSTHLIPAGASMSLIPHFCTLRPFSSPSP